MKFLAKIATKEGLVWVVIVLGKLLAGFGIYYMSSINGSLIKLNDSVQQITRIQDVQDIRIRYLEIRMDKTDVDNKDRDDDNKEFQREVLRNFEKIRYNETSISKRTK